MMGPGVTGWRTVPDEDVTASTVPETHPFICRSSADPYQSALIMVLAKPSVCLPTSVTLKGSLAYSP